MLVAVRVRVNELSDYRTRGLSTYNRVLVSELFVPWTVHTTVGPFFQQSTKAINSAAALDYLYLFLVQTRGRFIDDHNIILWQFLVLI